MESAGKASLGWWGWKGGEWREGLGKMVDLVLYTYIEIA
jgi:hypothetical protein